MARNLSNSKSASWTLLLIVLLGVLDPLIMVYSISDFKVLQHGIPLMKISNYRHCLCLKRKWNSTSSKIMRVRSMPHKYLSRYVKNQPFFINNRGFTERYFNDKVHASLMSEDCVAWRRQSTSAFKFRAKYCHIDL